MASIQSGILVRKDLAALEGSGRRRYPFPSIGAVNFHRSIDHGIKRTAHDNKQVQLNIKWHIEERLR